MPWNETCVMDLKVQLIADWLRGEHGVSALALGYGVSRKTVYKWIRRYQEAGVEGLTERSRAPHSRPHAVTADMAERVIAVKHEHPEPPREFRRLLGVSHAAWADSVSC